MDEVMTSSARSADLAGVRPQTLGAAIRGLRGERGIRLADLAEQTALSVSFLSQLERGLTNPSLPSLVRISAALGTSAHALLASLSPLSETPADPADPADPVPPVSPVYQGGEDGAYIDNLAGYARSLVRGRRAIQPMEVVGAATIMRNWVVHDADEFMYLCDGEAEVELEGRGLFRLTRGATVYCDAGVHHRWRQVGTETVRMLLVLASPQQARPLDVQLRPKRVKA
jgi:transcriptional regulator with XRE-family HTH domain